MTSYLLLRDNKQSGPLSLDQIIQVGFKPYDLVWVEGKSAAWRYPGEITELKAYAPVIEEQPFDRFFKKPEAEKHHHEEVKPQQVNPAPQKVILPENKKQEFTPAIERKTDDLPPKEIFIPKRSVYVTMPGNFKREREKEIEKATPPLPAPSPTPVISITETPPEVEIKYSQPLDEIKEMYVKTLLERKQKKVNRKFIFQNLKRASIFIILIGAGVLTGFVLRSRNNNDPVAMNKEILKPPENGNDQPEIILTSHQDEATIENSFIIEESKLPQNNDDQKIKEKIHEQEMPVMIPAKENIRKDSKTVINPNQNSPGAEINTVTGERNKKERNENTIEEKTEKKANPKNVPTLASVKSNNYQRGAFGGIRNLELTVTNKSKYLLDKVIVELQYLKPSEEPLKSEKIVFHSVPAEGTLTIAVPPTNRGIKVSYKVIHVESKEMNDETAGM